MSTPASRLAIAKGVDELNERFAEPETLRLQEVSVKQDNPPTAEDQEDQEEITEPVRESLFLRKARLDDTDAFDANPGVLIGERFQDIPEIYHYKPDNRNLLGGFHPQYQPDIYAGIPGLLADPAQQNRSMGVDWGRTSDEMAGMNGSLHLYRKNYDVVIPKIPRVPNPFTA